MLLRYYPSYRPTHRSQFRWFGCGPIVREIDVTNLELFSSRLMLESTKGETAPPVAATTSTTLKKSFNSTKLSTSNPLLPVHPFLRLQRLLSRAIVAFPLLSWIYTPHHTQYSMQHAQWLFVQRLLRPTTTAARMTTAGKSLLGASAAATRKSASDILCINLLQN